MPGSPLEDRVKFVELFVGTLLICAITPLDGTAVGVAPATGEPSVGVTCVVAPRLFALASLPCNRCSVSATHARASMATPPLKVPQIKLRLPWRCACSSCHAL